VLWRTVDGGRRWQPLARPENVGFQTIGAAGSWLLLDSAAGMFRSRDGGRSWTAFAPPSAPGASPYGLRIARPGLLADIDTGTIHASHDGGRSWTSAALPVGAGSGIATASFADPEHGLAAEEGFGCTKGGGLSPSHLFATADGGSSWEALPTPAFAVDQLVAVPGLTVAAVHGAECGANWLALSRDGGRDWNVQAFPHGQACMPSLAPPATVWLVCGGNRLLASTDGGSTWSELSGWLTIGAAAPVSSHRGWLVGTRRGEANPTLWQTTDGGRHWSERWPPLPIGQG
jgi:photosystem II stability/assembly factor-like uncharacterized protein